MLVPVKNNLTDYAQFSYLSEGVEVGESTLPVQNINPFVVSYPIQIGATGEEKTEIVTPGTVSGTALVCGTVRFDHPTDTPVYNLGYDKLIMKKSASGTSGVATAITDGTIPITPDGTVTVYNDPNGLSTDAYKVAFYNSALSISSSDSDWITPEGYAFYSLAAMRQRVKDKLRNATYIGPDQIINDWLNEWLEQMTNAAIKVNQDYALGTTNVSFGTSGLGTITARDFKTVRRVWITYNGTDYNPSTFQPINMVGPNDTISDAAPNHSFQGDNTILFRPSDTAGTAQIIYTKLNPVLVNDGDLLPLSLRGYTKSFVDYALAMARAKDEKESQSLLGQAQLSKNEFVNEMTPRDQTAPQTIQIVTPINGETYLDGYVNY